MNIKVLAVGRIQPMYKEIQTEFVKRLGRYCRCEVIEVDDEQAPESLSEAQKEQVMAREWERLEKKIAPDDFLVLLDGRGKGYSSTDFSAKLEQWQTGKTVVFALGGSLGFSEATLKKAGAVLKLSDMTLTHSMARVFLLEQIYRGFRIMKNEPYHK